MSQYKKENKMTQELTLHEQRKLECPLYLQQKADYQREYFAKNKEKMREYNKMYQRMYRARIKAQKEAQKLNEQGDKND